MTEEKENTSPEAVVRGPESEGKEKSKENITIRIQGFIDLIVGMVLCTIFLPRFVSAMYFDLTSGNWNHFAFYVIILIFYSSCAIGLLCIVSGIFLAFLKPLGIKIATLLSQ